jgi:hypothetical protein
MAFPWIFAADFERGIRNEWDSEQDTGSLLDFPHYTELARHKMTPYRGAYCMRVQMGDTNDHTVTEGDIDIADTATRYARWYMYLGDTGANNVAATVTDEFNIFEFQQAAGTVEASVGLKVTQTTNVVEIGIGDGLAPATYPFQMTKGVWNCIEAKMLVSTAGAGTLDLFVNDTNVHALNTLTNAAAVGTAQFGTMLTLATTTGTILFDDFRFDDGRVFSDPQRYRVRNARMTTASDHIIIGPGRVTALVTGTSTDAVLSLYDSDGAHPDIGDLLTLSDNPLAIIRNVSANEVVPGHDVFEVTHGLYAILAGTNAQAFFSIDRAAVVSDAGMINRGQRQGRPKP